MSRKTNRFSRLKSREDSGFSSNASGRFIDKNGIPNIKRTGLSNPLDKYSWYHTLLGLETWKFLSFLVLIYIVINILFALIYYSIGIQHLTGIDKSNIINEFTDVFFFSSQTFTTVGYGRIAPIGFMASLVATFEAFLGLLAFAIATGLFYGRFSRPRAFLKFSKIALVAPYEDVTALMFRLAPYKNNLLTDAQIILNAAIEGTDDEGNPKTNFFTLETTLSKINSLVLNWTIVHKIDENSPFFEFTKENFATTNIEIFAQIRAFDEVFSNTVVQRTSYVSSEIVFGGKFLPMYYPSEDKQSTILNLDKIDDYQPVNFIISAQ